MNNKPNHGLLQYPLSTADEDLPSTLPSLVSSAIRGPRSVVLQALLEANSLSSLMGVSKPNLNPTPNALKPSVLHVNNVVVVGVRVASDNVRCGKWDSYSLRLEERNERCLVEQAP